MKVYYFVRTTAANKQKEVTIRLRLRDGRQVNMFAATPLSVPLEYWNNKAKNNRDKIRDRTDFLERDWYKDKLEALEKDLKQNYQRLTGEPTAEWLKTTIDNFFHPEKYEKKPVTLFEFIENYIESSKHRINPQSGKKIAESTLKKYTTCFNYLKEYAQYKKKNVDFKDVDIAFYTGFVKFLNNKVISFKDKETGEEVKKIGLAVNTIGKQIAVLKGFLNQAAEQGINKYTAFKRRGFTIITEEAETIYLNEQELNKLNKLDLSEDKRLDRIRDLFLIGCWTGCRFSDFSTITHDQIRDGYLYVKQEKTGARVVIPLHPVVKSILNKYEGELPPAPSNQKFNDYIKEVCELAGIDESVQKGITRGGRYTAEELPKSKLVSSHTARRSFATNLYKNGFPTISIMKITGHASEKAFLKYIKVTPEEHAKLLAAHWQKFNKEIERTNEKKS